MTIEEAFARLEELNLFIAHEPDVLVRLDMIQERQDLQGYLHPSKR